ncbi:MAG TPA: peptidoglycan DD-metalloendopeptidase family protein [Geminicoccaceae bacterium]|nr:peptidoglycan DD-metalloendopeptidase family protein [Geminicoccaceae bacterium]
MIGAVVLVGLAGLPGTSAGLAPPEASGEHFEARRLADVRERLEHRRALQRSLQGQVDGLARKIDDLGVRLERTSTMLQSERQEALLLERRLDQLVPRFLARMAEARDYRARAARALADLAGMSRSPDLDPRMRARMSALSPLLLQRLGNAEAGLELLREHRDETIERHARIERRLPGLTTEHQRLQRLSSANHRLRAAALDELRGLQAELDLLGREQAQLARRFLRREAARVARAEPQADQRALPDVSAMPRAPLSTTVRIRSAAVEKGGIAPTPRVTRVAEAWDRIESRVAAAASEPRAGLDSSALAAAAGAPTKSLYRPGPFQVALPGESPPARPGGSRDAIARATALDVAFRREDDLSGRRSATARGGQGAAPILPLPEAAQDRVMVAHGGPELTFSAAPGQRVAAPVAGKVVFAGTFKSYGWLLILEHEREDHTLLWGFARLDVERGDQVRVGQIVGIMDARGDDPPVLHVERRRNGRPIDLAASSNGIQG